MRSLKKKKKRQQQQQLQQQQQSASCRKQTLANQATEACCP